MSTRTSILLVLLTVAISCAVTANEGPTASFTAYSVENGSDVTVLFDASGSTDPDGTVTAYRWVFGDGTSGSGVEVEHTFPRADRFNVSLLVLDDVGSWHRITQTVDVANLSALSGDGTQGGDPADAYPVPTDVPIGNDVGERAPDFSLPDVDGVMRNLSDFRGQVVLLEFWKSTCPGCQASVAVLEGLRERYDEQGLVVLLVTLDSSTADVERYLTEHGLTELIALREPRGFQGTIIYTYGVSVTPTVLLIDRTGVIRYRGYGSDLTESLILQYL